MKIKSKEIFRKTLKKLILEKEIKEITIFEISKESGLTRQIFYYYFKNIDKLIEYYFEKEMELLIKSKKTIKNINEIHLYYFDYLRENHIYMKKLYNSSKKEILRNALELMSKQIYTKIVFDYINNKNISEDKKELFISFNSQILANFSYNFIKNGLRENSMEIILKISIIYIDNILSTLKKLEILNT